MIVPRRALHALSGSAALPLRLHPHSPLLTSRGPDGPSPVLCALATLLFCVALRAINFGNPLVDIDEEFYLFAGGQMLHGAMPYVAVWDRKPIGLFLIYAFFHLFGPQRILAYQLGATLSVWLTGLILMHMARRVAPPTGALVAGLLYIAALDLAGGQGGQSPVFYNLPVAAAMALLLGTTTAQATVREVRRTGRGAMLLFGLALQIKYTVVFEGAFAGLFLLWRVRAAGASLPVLLAETPVWVALAVAPTAAAALAYTAAGQGHAWWFANVVSIFRRGQRPPAVVLHHGVRMIAFVVPPLLCLPLRRLFAVRLTAAQRPAMRFIDLWALTAVAGVAVFGSWYNHYALPLFAPLALLAAPLWQVRKGRLWCGLLLAVATIDGMAVVAHHRRKGGNRATYEALVAVLSRPPGCVFLYNGPPILYDTIGFCPLTDHPFPGHFNEDDERDATGIDPQAELRKVMAAHPRYVVNRDPAIKDENLAVRAELDALLAGQYKRVARIPESRHTALVVYRRDTP